MMLSSHDSGRFDLRHQIGRRLHFDGVTTRAPTYARCLYAERVMLRRQHMRAHTASEYRHEAGVLIIITIGDMMARFISRAVDA